MIEDTESARGKDNEDAEGASYEQRMRTSEKVEEEAADADPIPGEDSSATDIGVRADYELPSVVKDRQEPDR
ncbi:MAG: hypothetical protein M3300_05925 [Actinomycetota bacterium]|nr:hypothetical protein [Actinomycetota bacterium]